MKIYLLLFLCIATSIASSNVHASASDIRFARACEPGNTLIIGAAGDVLLHGPLQKQGYQSGFNSLWSTIESFMEGPDVMYANLEGPAAEGVAPGGKSVKDPGLVFDGHVHSGYPAFNYHPVIISDLKKSGVDILSTANNHAMDRGVLGVQRTIEAMEDFAMPYIGTRTDNSTLGGFYRVTEQKGFRLGWIACSWGTNGIPDKNDLVLDCFDTDRVSKYIKDLKPQVDAVIVTPHWGDEYQNKPNSQQIKFGRRWLEDGAAAVIGAHPHVPQTWEKYKSADGREGLILFSLGNFVSNQSGTAKQSSLLLFLGLTKNNGKTWVNGVRYLPLFMKRAPYSVVASNAVKGNSEVSASLSHVKNMFGEERIVKPGEDVVTNPECD
jgi:poly-gamma-glutamate synthesis protein (capsule biosynthesis protein)